MTPPTRAGLSSRKLLSSIGIGAVVAAVAIFVGAATTGPRAAPTLSALDELESSTSARTSATSAAAVPMATTSSSQAPSTSPAQPSPFTIDEYGFVGTAARCDSSQFVIAFGRTERSIVAICADQAGNYEYRGVRLSDKATVKLGVEAQDDGEFVARGDGITYVVSPQEFYLMSGSEVLREEPWLEYHEPRLAAETPGPETSSTETSDAETTDAETTVRPSSISPETFDPVG